LFLAIRLDDAVDIQAKQDREKRRNTKTEKNGMLPIDTPPLNPAIRQARAKDSMMIRGMATARSELQRFKP